MQAARLTEAGRGLSPALFGMRCGSLKKRTSGFVAVSDVPEQKKRKIKKPMVKVSFAWLWAKHFPVGQICG